MALNFEFLTANLIDTTTSIAVSANTSSASGLIDRKIDSVWKSDTQTALITISLPTTATVDRIVLQNTNMKQFSVYGNTTTALFSITTTSGTTTTDFTGNSATSIYFILSSGTATDTINIDCSTTTDSAVASIGEFWVATKLYRLDKNPSHQYYKPKLRSKEIKHVMSDGGTTLYRINNSYQTDIQLKYQTQTVVDSLKDIYDRNESISFVPFPVAAIGSWAGDDIYLVNWVGDFQFKEASGNVPEVHGYNGIITLQEAPK